MSYAGSWKRVAKFYKHLSDSALNEILRLQKLRVHKSPSVWKHPPCSHCGSFIGPDITGRPACYGCAPVDMLPREVMAGRKAETW